MPQKSITSFFAKRPCDEHSDGVNPETFTSAVSLPTSEAPPSAKKKFCPDYDNNRSVKAEWFALFPWLVLDKEKFVFTCRDCVKAGKTNSLTTGKDASKPKKDDFVKHERNKDHKLSSQAEIRHGEMVQVCCLKFRV